MNAQSQIKPGRYLLFCFQYGGGKGGTEDLQKAGDDKDVLIKQAQEEQWEVIQIFDTVTGTNDVINANYNTPINFQ